MIDSPTFIYIYNIILKAVVWVVVVLAVVIMYWKIFLVVHRQRRQISVLSQSSNTNDTTEGITKNNKRSAMVFVIIMAFIVLWLPYIIYSIILAFYPEILAYGINTSTTVTLYIMFVMLALGNSAVNAFIYARFDRDFRNAYRQLLRCK